MDAKFKSLWQHKTKRAEETVEQYELNAFPTKPYAYLNSVVLLGKRWVHIVQQFIPHVWFYVAKVI